MGDQPRVFFLSHFLLANRFSVTVFFSKPPKPIFIQGGGLAINDSNAVAGGAH